MSVEILAKWEDIRTLEYKFAIFCIDIKEIKETRQQKK